ncbi:hypothetical protein SCB49_14040 [unidentified eubacterium SCB49]|nr:hypothetical protein SCB49_14040 [unidentified eubacterium SCB49]
MKEKIQFKKQRDIGEIITDTFKFIRTEWKPLGTLILKIAGPALLILIVAASMYTQTALGSFSTLGFNNTGPELFTGTVIISLIVMMFSTVAYFSLLYGTILNYIKSYVNNNGIADAEEVKNGVYSNFWSLIGLGFLIGLITGVGFMLCVIPGVYVGVVFGTAYSIHVFQKRAVDDTISYSFKFIKDEWWITFATYIVIYILFYIINLVFQIPLIIYTFVKTFTAINETSMNPAEMFDWGYTALNGISLLAQYILQSILVISTVFVYFNLNEKKNFTGTIEAIDTLGASDQE